MARRYRLRGVVEFIEDDPSIQDADYAHSLFDHVTVYLGESNVLGPVKVLEKHVEDLGPAEET